MSEAQEKLFPIFNNLSTNERASDWVKESHKECFYTYPLILEKKDIGPYVCVDIGANIGGFCLHAYHGFDKFDKIYAFEPCYENYKLLTIVSETFNLESVEAHQLAVYSESDVSLNVYKHNGGCSGDVICQPDLYNEQKNTHVSLGQTCKTISLDDIFVRFGLEIIDLLKIDAEGAEHEIFKTFRDYHRIRTIVMELHGDAKKRALLNKLVEHYHVFSPDLLSRQHGTSLPPDANGISGYALPPLSQVIDIVSHQSFDLDNYSDIICCLSKKDHLGRTQIYRPTAQGTRQR